MKKGIALLAALALVIFLLPAQAAMASIPVLVVKSFKATPAPTQPGEVFTLEVVIKNEGQKDAQNISVTLGAAATNAEGMAKTPDFLPVESGNVAFIEELKDGEETTVSFTLTSRGDTAPGIYDADLTLSYSYSRMTFSNQAKIGLVIQQNDALAVKGLSYPVKIKLGETAAITGEIVNISNGLLKAVTVDYSGAGLEKQSEFYGIFEPNNSDSIENTLKPEKAGTAQVEIAVSYYDSFGKRQELKKQIAITVEDPQNAPQGAQAKGDNFFIAVFKFLFGLGG